MAAVPKKKHTPMRQGRRRATIKARTIVTMICKSCGANKLSHHACPACGATK